MNSSSIVRGTCGQAPHLRSPLGSTQLREYRRNRQHLYPLEDYQAAVAEGGVATSYCGITVVVRRGDPATVVEVDRPEAGDCVTCVDIWHGEQWVRL